jgi:mycothiol synthase
MFKFLLDCLYGSFEAKLLLKIRPFRKGFDEKAYVSLFNAAFSDYDDIRSITFEEMKKMEEAPGFSVDGMIIAEWSGETAGMINAYIDRLREEKKGFVQSLAVLPKFRRKGIANKLVEEALKSLRDRGMKVAEAWAQSDREDCVHIYESFGFKRVRIMSMMKRSLDVTFASIGENKEARIKKIQVQNEREIGLLNWLDNETFKEHFNFRPKTIEETKYTLFENPWFRRQEWFFAILDNQPVGYVGVGVDEGLNREKSLKWGWILDIGVLKPHRRKGIGNSLMFYALKLLKTMQMDDAVLYVDDMNPTGAIKLYEKLGFKVLRKHIVYQLPLTR